MECDSVQLKIAANQWLYNKIVDLPQESSNDHKEIDIIIDNQQDSAKINEDNIEGIKCMIKYRYLTSKHFVDILSQKVKDEQATWKLRGCSG